MTEISRRDLLATAVAAGSIAMLGSVTSAQTSTKPGFNYEIKPLPFNPAKLHGISEKLIVSHHDKNYAGAVKRLGVIQEKRLCCKNFRLCCKNFLS